LKFAFEVEMATPTPRERLPNTITRIELKGEVSNSQLIKLLELVNIPLLSFGVVTPVTTSGSESSSDSSSSGNSSNSLSSRRRRRRRARRRSPRSDVVGLNSQKKTSSLSVKTLVSENKEPVLEVSGNLPVPKIEIGSAAEKCVSVCASVTEPPPPPLLSLPVSKGSDSPKFNATCVTSLPVSKGSDSSKFNDEYYATCAKLLNGSCKGVSDETKAREKVQEIFDRLNKPGINVHRLKSLADFAVESRRLLNFN
jgi:hypothetical protein